ncbi:MAG: tRNA-dihydrouridine synthase family protein [Spirochaetaceae bacterium]|jgi:tRNA-dihydrouridine synthase|nr:tRNA-dihydrouridine synthase family protein [Spirochaetaceae bacterium]
MRKIFMLAPMAEISHRALRELIAGFGGEEGEGPDEYFTEMISAGALLGGGPFERWYLDGGPCPEKLVYQLVGSDPDQLERAAGLLDRREFEGGPCLGIDINMGCAAPAIRRVGAGVAWMASAEAAGALAGRVRRVVSRRLSVKLRIGFRDDFEELLRFCRRLEEEGVDLITLHPRTAGEKFRRNARWDYVERLRGDLNIPVAGNGDIASPEEMLRRAKSGPVMVGRAAVRRPWIFAVARRLDRRLPGTAETAGAAGGEKVPGTVNLEETGVRFLELLARCQPPEFHLSRARRFFSYFCDNLKWGTYVKNLLNREESLGGIERAWRSYFAEEREAHTLQDG